ncbi:unnamed protein product [Brassicogethes aeneus]|uniref:Sphingomyelin phosphodiesterase n=1 Tax=Brassicogethes aeneus TaxID=1431903 RepID=A0A9P0FMJ9_BRAAE|nr:unnamed protein product [Brassicogethes aeneus]
MPSVDSGNFNILHLSDFHYDPMYTPGKNVACEDPLCCQVDSDDPKNSSSACGYWTEYKNADIPWHTLEELLKQVQNHDFDFVYFTGDIISHRVWSTSIESNTQAIKEVYQLFRDKFSVPVFPILGNHEPTPINQWSKDVADPNLSTSWLYELVAQEWSSWLPTSALETIRHGGYYTVSPRPGFRVIVLNSNVCYNLNWWLIYDDFDPYNQLSWLTKTLLESEQNGESVHILSHIPSGNGNCLHVWSREFNKIVQRFANTITGQFNGHTHTDEFQVYFNQSNPSEAVNVAYNGASLVTYVDSNPSYKVIEVNNETYNLNDIVEWTFNLTEANLSPEIGPNWYKLYSFKHAYNLADLKPKTVGNLLYTMAKNHTLLEQFNNFRFRNSDNKQMCDQKCQRDVLCVVSVTLYGNNDKCNELQNIFDESL